VATDSSPYQGRLPGPFLQDEEEAVIVPPQRGWRFFGCCCRRALPRRPSQPEPEQGACVNGEVAPCGVQQTHEGGVCGNRSKMSWVGNGKGNFQAVTRYEFVGHGIGEFENSQQLPPPQGECPCSMCCCVAGTVGLIVLVGAILSLVPVGRALHRCQGAEVWTVEESMWCCTQKGVGCAAPPPATPGPMWDCRAGLEDISSWSLDRRHWCCLHTGRACWS